MKTVAPTLDARTVAQKAADHNATVRAANAAAARWAAQQAKADKLPSIPSGPR